MGTWETNLKDNDTFLDIYTSFFDSYNDGEEPETITRIFIAENTDVINDVDDSNNFWFALALAQWETKSLNSKILNTVQTTINTDSDLNVWQNLGAGASALKRRKKVLEKFLQTLSTEKEKPKRRKKSKPLDYYVEQLLSSTAPDQKKTFTLSEHGTSKGYNYTGGYVSWLDGGGSVLFYDKPNRNITVNWLDTQTLVVRHEKEIVFSKQDFQTQYYRDIVKIVYVPV